MEYKFTSANFEEEVLKSDQPVLVDFYADWCGPCKMMAPVVAQLADELEGKAKVGKLNIDDCMDIAGKYRVMNIPTLPCDQGRTGSGEDRGSGFQKRAAEKDRSGDELRKGTYDTRI